MISRWPTEVELIGGQKLFPRSQLSEFFDVSSGCLCCQRLREKKFNTRMHSSRIRTGRALTVLGGGAGWCIPEEFFLGGGKKLKKKRKKNLETPLRKFGGSPPNWRPPPENLEDPPKIWRIPPGPDHHLLPPPVDRHTLVKILPWPNFVAAGKYIRKCNN